MLFVPDGRQALGLLIDDGNPGRFPGAPDAEKQKALQATVATGGPRIVKPASKARPLHFRETGGLISGIVASALSEQGDKP